MKKLKEKHNFMVLNRMNNFEKYLLILSIFFIYLLHPVYSVGQEIQPTVGTNQKQDEIFYLNFIKEKKNLNKIQSEPLKRFFKILGITETLASALMNYRNIHGEIENFNELLLIGFDNENIERMKSYFYLESNRVSTDEILRDYSDDDLENISFFNDLQLNPMNLNNTPVKYLAELPSMNLEKANRLDEYRKNHTISALFDLTNAGLTEGELLTISPFITIKPPEKKSFSFKSFIGYEDKSTYKLTNSLINESNISSTLIYRFNVDTKFINLYYATENLGDSPVINPIGNSNEIFLRSRYNALIQIENYKFLLGHYKISLGQNLLFGPSFIPPLSDIDSFPIKKLDRGIEPYYSLAVDSDNNGKRDFFNGAAICYEDAPVNISDFSPALRITGFYSYFYYDSINKMHSQRDYGGNISSKIPLFDTTLGLTAANQTRYDKKFDSTGLSFNYDSLIFDNFNLYGEIAEFDGISGVQGLILKNGFLKTSLLGYYAQTNFNAPNGTDIIRDSKNTRGMFAGIDYNFIILQTQLYADLSSKITNNSIEQRYQAKLNSKVKIDENWIKTLDFEVKTKYSDYQDTINLRSYFMSEGTFFNQRFYLTFKWQNLLNFTAKEMGNMSTLRSTIKPFSWFYIIGRWNNYHSASFDSALYALEEELYLGETSLKSYYGIGNEYTAAIKFVISDILEIGIKYIYDQRKTAYMTGAEYQTIDGFIKVCF